MKIIDVVQGTQEWLDARVGLVTASNMNKIITPAKGEPSKQMRDLAFHMLAETVIGHALDDASSAFMQRGTMMEEEARAWYELEYSVDVRRVGLLVSDDELFGASPDGLVGDEGGLEIKCPTAPVHLKYLLDGPGADYYTQVQGSLWVSGLKWWDFLSFCPGFPARVIRYTPDEDFIRKMAVAGKQYRVLYKELETQLYGMAPYLFGRTESPEDGEELS